MTGQDARKLKTGDRLMWSRGTQYQDEGTVTSRTGWKGICVNVAWDSSDPSSLHVDDMQRAELIA